MVPTDDLEVEPGQVPAGNEPAEPTPPGDDLPAKVLDGTVTPEQFVEFLNQAAENQNRPIAEQLQQVMQVVQQLQQERTPKQEPLDTNELAERLLTDPKGTLKELMTEWGRENLAAPLAANFEAQRDERIETRATEIDEDWGDGYFDEHIRPRLTGEHGVLAQWPIDQQSNPRIIDSAIDGIMGTDYRNPEKRAAMAEALQKTAKARAEREVRQPPHMMGPGRVRQSAPDTLTPDMKHTLEGFQDVIPGLTEATIKAALRRPNTLSAWKEATQQ